MTDQDKKPSPLVAAGAPLERPGRPHRTPTRDEVEALMKRCQIGVGGRHAIDNAHDIMAECYGMLGLLWLCVEFYQTLATCECGDEFSAHDPGTCGACLAGMTCSPGVELSSYSAHKGRLGVRTEAISFCGSAFSEDLGPDAEWARAWFEARYQGGDVFVDGQERLTLEGAADLVRDARQMQSQRIKAALLGLQDEAGDRHNYYAHAVLRVFGA